MTKNTNYQIGEPKPNKVYINVLAYQNRGTNEGGWMLDFYDDDGDYESITARYDEEPPTKTYDLFDLMMRCDAGEMIWDAMQNDADFYVDGKRIPLAQMYQMWNVFDNSQ
jgi:hypothetical protein